MLTRTTVKRRSLRSRLLSWFLRRRFKPKLMRPDFDPARFRVTLDRDMGKNPIATGVEVVPVQHQGIHGEWLVPASCNSQRVVLYSHGGGYLFGSPLSYRAFSSRLAVACDARVFVLDYRLAPEHPFPAAADDVIAAYRYLLTEHDAANIVLAGDSAGAGLSLSLLVQIREAGLAMPSAAVLLSPYADLAVTGESVDSNSATCAMFSGDAIRRAAATYLNGAPATDARASPLYAEYTGFPPLLIYVSDNEVLRDDGLRVAERAAAADVATDLRVWHGQPHVWPLFVPVLPEANQVLKEMGAFVQGRSA
ncbi:MAG: alpha/beta hydrolase [Gammaproteobacteria bacterium]|nr:alpha/beta hydrolase [Gammaproteobacteria bacterium]|tara:strand:- start:1669 stop:2592 length:924 start_codon:yes stop_codon:yes gene_type:complete